MTLGNMRELGVQRLIASRLNDACRHLGLVYVSKFPDDIECRRLLERSCARSAAVVGTRSTFGRTGKEQPTRPTMLRHEQAVMELIIAFWIVLAIVVAWAANARCPGLSSVAERPQAHTRNVEAANSGGLDTSAGLDRSGCLFRLHLLPYVHG
jgi:hypothetical protein